MRKLRLEDFWSFVNKRSGVFNTVDGKRSQCWVWTGPTYKFGYGRFAGYAHRIAWELTNGPIPEGLFGLHKCDNPPCVRPSHLFLGTRKDNSEDMKRKGRSAVGDRNGMRKHPERRPFGARNGSHNHPERVARGDNHYMTKVRLQDRKRIKKLYATGKFLQRELGAMFGVTRASIGQF
jgi:HNH endonuclease